MQGLLAKVWFPTGLVVLLWRSQLSQELGPYTETQLPRWSSLGAGPRWSLEEVGGGMVWRGTMIGIFILQPVRIVCNTGENGI